METTINLYDYILHKLKDKNDSIETKKNQLLEASRELNIERLTLITNKIDILINEKNKLSKDAAKYLSVEQVISLINLNYLNIYSVAYTYRFDKPITTEERKALMYVNHSFKSAKIKD